MLITICKKWSNGLNLISIANKFSDGNHQSQKKSVLETVKVNIKYKYIQRCFVCTQA